MKKLIRIHTEASSGHPRGRVIQKIYGEKFEHLTGDIVKPAHEGSTEQMIELILSFHSAYEDTPANVEVTGDGDDINQPLSEDRAENVHSMLQTYLNHPEVYEFEVKGFGKYEPIATNDTEEGRERNHRVETLLQVESDTD